MVHNQVVDRPSVALVGTGRLGSTLALALHGAGYPIVALVSRTSSSAAELAGHVGAAVVEPAVAIRQADLTVLAVPDDQLAPLTAALARQQAWLPGKAVVHCSGVLPAAALAPAAEYGALVGGFHPLAAFAARMEALPTGIAFAIEASGPLHDILWRMAGDLQGVPFDIDPAARTLYHAAAVLLSNYTVVLAALAAGLLEQAGMPDNLALGALLPLLDSTRANLRKQGLPAALTGPLVRGDAETVERHLMALEQTAPAIAEVYRVLADAALPLVRARGELDHQTIDQLGKVIGRACAR